MGSVENFQLQEAERRQSLADRTWSWGMIQKLGGLGAGFIGLAIGGVEAANGYPLPGAATAIIMSGVGALIYRDGKSDIALGETYKAEAKDIHNDAVQTESA